MDTIHNNIPSVHMVCQAHIDPIWIWDWPEGLTETLATFESAANLLDEYPEFVFNHNESVLYEWTKEHHPQLYKRIKKHVKDGRWVITGGWYLQPDAILPSGESVARQILIGRRFFQKEFGVLPSVAYNLDSFGHHGNLPQFLKLSGYTMYTHFRPSPDKMPLPDFIYKWQGVDGSEVLALRPPDGWYCTHPGSLVESKVHEMYKLSARKNRPTTVFWGAGNHGGGATRKDLEKIREISSKYPNITHSGFERYCSEVVEKEAAELSVKTGELQKCFTGCYTSVIGNKMRNRRGEGLALAAERYAAMAWWLLGEPYPAEKLTHIWKDVLFNQFHDILPGTSIREGVISAAEMTGRAATDAREVLVKAQLQLMRNEVKTEPLLIRLFNSHPEKRMISAKIDVQLATHPEIVEGKYLALYDSEGREVARQILEYLINTAAWRSTFIFDAELPALGIAEYQIRLEDYVVEKAGGNSDEIPSDFDPDAFIHTVHKKIHDDSCRVADQSPWYRLDSDKITVNTALYSAEVNLASGLLTSLFDKGRDFEFIGDPSCRLIVRSDSNDAWGGTQFSYGSVVGEFELPDSEELAEISGQYDDQNSAAPVRIISSGPLALVVETLLVYKRSVARLRYTFHRNHQYVDMELMVNFNERRRALQLEISTNLQGNVYETEIPHAAIRRSQDNGEEAVGRWIALNDKDENFTLVNDGPGGAEIDQNRIRQSLIRTPVYGSGNSDVDPGFMGEHMDLGEHRFRFRVLFGSSDSVISMRQIAADDFIFPLFYHCSVPLDASEKPGLKYGTEPLRLLKVSGAGIIHMEALKVSEDGEHLVLRIAERSGRSVSALIEAHGMESLTLEFGAFEMKTLRSDKVKWIECNLLERPMD